MSPQNHLIFLTISRSYQAQTQYLCALLLLHRVLSSLLSLPSKLLLTLDELVLIAPLRCPQMELSYTLPVSTPRKSSISRYYTEIAYLPISPLICVSLESKDHFLIYFLDSPAPSTMHII